MYRGKPKTKSHGEWFLLWHCLKYWLRISEGCLDKLLSEYWSEMDIELIKSTMENALNVVFIYINKSINSYCLVYEILL